MIKEIFTDTVPLAAVFCDLQDIFQYPGHLVPSPEFSIGLDITVVDRHGNRTFIIFFLL